MFDFLTKSNITFILSIIGSAGAISGWILSFVRSRQKLLLLINGYRETDKGFLTHIQFVNRSRLSVAITQISVYTDKGFIPCSLISEIAVECVNKTNGLETSRDRTFSLPFPINLPSLGGCSGYVYFPYGTESFQVPPSKATFLVCTNRRKAVEMTLVLGKLLD